MSGRQRAIVIGGSMSGLLAARVLASHFKEVVLFDRDVFPPSPEFRRGVPQGQHAHALLMSGREVLDGLFPGFRDELVGQGAIRGQYRRVRWFDNGVYHNTRFDGLDAGHRLEDARQAVDAAAAGHAGNGEGLGDGIHGLSIYPHPL